MNLWLFGPLCLAASPTGDWLQTFTLKGCIKGEQVDYKGHTLVLGCLWYERRIGQIAGDLTRVRHGALALERLDGAVQMVRRPDCGKGRDVDLHLTVKKIFKGCGSEFFIERVIACDLLVSSH